MAILHEAEVELWEAVEFYESRSPGLGLDFLIEIGWLQHRNEDPKTPGERKHS